MAIEKVYYTMGEVAEMFDVKASLIRHWEAKFSCLRPVKNKKGNRLFSQDDIDLLKQIYHLVKEQGMTLDGANKVMRSSRSGNSLRRDAELLERLQKIRSALVEVREELKAGDDEHLVDMADYTSMSEEQPEASKSATSAKSAKRSSAKAQAQLEGADVSSEEKPVVGSEQQSESGEQPMRRVRRRRKSDEEDKELFPFYEQSLF